VLATKSDAHCSQCHPGMRLRNRNRIIMQWLNIQSPTTNHLNGISMNEENTHSGSVHYSSQVRAGADACLWRLRSA
jgi:hypothetical protein